MNTVLHLAALWLLLDALIVVLMARVRDASQSGGE